MDKLLDLPVAVYTPDSQMRTPGLLISSMWRDLKASRELSWRLFIRDLSAQYRQSLFGILWAFIPPLITSAIFIFLQSRNVVNIGETSVPYPAFVLISTVLWQMFTESINAPLKSVTAAKPLLVKINFPRESLVVSSFYLVLFNSLIKAIIIALIFLIFRLQPTWGLLLAPLAVFFLLLLGIGLGLLITPLGMLYTDIATGLPILLQLLFFVTPVVYPPPETFPLSLIAIINPISPLLIAARDLITVGTISNPVAFYLMSGLTLVLALVAWVIYRVMLPIIIERMSA
jgi:lipopolysaccharide transport system permease protein